jgi:hypothetical protein
MLPISPNLDEPAELMFAGKLIELEAFREQKIPLTQKACQDYADKANAEQSDELKLHPRARILRTYACVPVVRR